MDSTALPDYNAFDLEVSPVMFAQSASPLHVALQLKSNLLCSGRVSDRYCGIKTKGSFF